LIVKGWRERIISPSRREWEQVMGELQKEFCKDLFGFGYSREEMTRLQWAFSEAVYNKVKHGNGFDPKKKTRVRWKVDEKKVEVKVKDEGEKFDYVEALRNAEKKEDKYASVALLDGWNPKNCGAGLAITLRNLGRKSISYDEGGREVSLNYKRPKRRQVFVPEE
jgi:anti-sigma regulatory factor (Ser/Thr protein kinase)